MIRGSFLARRGTAGAPGHAGPVAVQYAVLDRADHIRVWPDRPSPPPDGTDLSPAGGEG
jgi:hypothetical protein